MWDKMVYVLVLRCGDVSGPAPAGSGHERQTDTMILLLQLFLLVLQGREYKHFLVDKCLWLLFLACLLIEKAQNLSSRLFTTSFFVGHDSICGRQDNVTELTTGQKVDNPLFDFGVLDIESRADDTTLVQSAIELDNNLICSVIINDFKFPNVSMLLHATKELDNNL